MLTGYRGVVGGRSSLLHSRDVDRFSVDQIVSFLVNLLNAPVHLDLLDNDVGVDGLGRVVWVVHHVEVQISLLISWLGGWRLFIHADSVAPA